MNCPQGQNELAGQLKWNATYHVRDADAEETL